MPSQDYHLTNGEEQHEKHPETFWIPSRDARISLIVGDSAKVIFNPSSNIGFAERMWVKITEVLEPGKYVGTLDNHPVNPQFNGLHLGSVVEFESCHVIQISPALSPAPANPVNEAVYPLLGGMETTVGDLYRNLRGVSVVG